MELPGGVPKRLTRDKSPREYGPAWSSDGKKIAFVSWDDESGGALHVVSGRGGRSKKITRTSAKYSNPSFSPDGREVVLLRGSGSHRRGGELAWELWSDIVIVDLATGAESIVTSTGGKRGARPRFSADGTRILFPESKGQGRKSPKGVLLSVNRNGTDRREILEVGNAVDIIPSPDGKWVAFVEQHHAWVAAIPETGRASFSVVRDSGSTPGWRLSEMAGDWVDFTADSSRVTWNYGPEFHQLGLADLVAWEEDRQERKRQEEEADESDSGGDDDDSAEEAKAVEKEEDPADSLPPSQSTELVLEVPRAVPRGTLAFISARVITMRGEEVLEGQTLVIQGDRILALGSDGTVDIPEGALQVDAAGTTIIPGLIDVHAHMHFSAHDVMPEQDWRYFANLAYGVTTIHDPSAISDQVFSFGELVETGDMVGPRIFSTGQILYGAGGAFRSEVGKLEDARRHVRRMKQLGAISVKSYQQPRRDQRQWIVQACREEGMLDIPEGGGDLLDNLGMVLDGHSAIEHALPVAPLYRDVIELFAQSDTYYSPTLLVAYGGASGEHYFYAQEPVWGNERLATFTPQGTLDARSRRLTLVAAEDDWHHQSVARSAAAIQDAGGKVTLGGHGQLQGLGAHWELWALAGPGAMSPHEALRAATLDGAKYLGMDADLGSIEVGKLADFVVLERDPLEKIENSDSVRQVVKGGVLYDASTMHRLWPEPASRARFMWEVAEGKELPTLPSGSDAP
jgi:imidazolonepropionase-like amidohydrolase